MEVIISILNMFETTNRKNYIWYPIFTSYHLGFTEAHISDYH